MQFVSNPYALNCVCVQFDQMSVCPLLLIYLDSHSRPNEYFKQLDVKFIYTFDPG